MGRWLVLLAAASRKDPALGRSRYRHVGGADRVLVQSQCSIDVARIGSDFGEDGRTRCRAPGVNTSRQGERGPSPSGSRCRA